VKNLSDVKAMIPEVLPSQSEPSTKPIASLDRTFIFFPFSTRVVVDGFLVHYRQGGIDTTTFGLESLGLFYATTCHHLAISGLIGPNEPVLDNVQKSVALSPRQKQILSGMVDAKTNHDLAQELGFSVSTIRHETMEIYQILGASDRKEAAQIALRLNLI
jgi:DNA-binding CsgD family transcriptional regulator